MPIYHSEAQLYSCLRALFDLIETQEPTATNALLKASLAITFTCSAPAASLTIDARKAPVNLAYGPSAVRPTIEVGLTTDTLHCLLLGEMRLAKAIGSDLLDLKGPVWKTLSLADVFHHAQRFYPLILQERGLPTTCPDLGRAA